MTKRISLLLLACTLLFATFACKRSSTTAGPKATATGAALVEVSGSKQAGRTGAPLDQPIVVQVNDAQGAAVPGASVSVYGPAGTKVEPDAGLTDASGQFTAQASAPGMAGHFQVVARTTATDGKTIELKMDEVALGYEQMLGRQINLQYCVRCHDPESTAERVSNMDNLDPKPHPYTEGETLNKISDADLESIITHGGPALNKSAAMPPYGYTLTKPEIQALMSYIRAIADPPYQASGVVNAPK